MSARNTVAEVQRAIGEVIVGNEAALRQILAAVLAGGHVLIEDLPGLGKTLIARTFATVLGLSFKRIQFTPDLLPADILGSSLYDLTTGTFEFRPGPVFTNLLMADEINRTPPKTQSALLEAMGEGQVSVEGRSIELSKPFIVIATDNPIEHEGTYPLPEAQLDRFMIRIRLGYLGPADEAEMLAARVVPSEGSGARAVIDGAEVLRLQRAVHDVTVHPDLIDYVVALLTNTREHPSLELGASPRAGLDLIRLAKATALIDSRDYVRAEDLKDLASAVLCHRVAVKPELWVRRIKSEDIVRDILARTPVPRLVGRGE